MKIKEGQTQCLYCRRIWCEGARGWDGTKCWDGFQGCGAQLTVKKKRAPSANVNRSVQSVDRDAYESRPSIGFLVIKLIRLVVAGVFFVACATGILPVLHKANESLEQMPALAAMRENGVLFVALMIVLVIALCFVARMGFAIYGVKRDPLDWH